MELHPRFYVRQLKQRLRPHVLQPAPSRLAWLPLHVAVIVVGTLAIARGWTPWPVIPLLSFVIGLSFAALMFLGHETLHGGVIRGRYSWLKPIVGWIAFAPFTVSPQLWVVWHNRVHHANTQRIAADPDMYPTLETHPAKLSIDSQSITSRSAVGDGAPSSVSSSASLANARRHRGKILPRHRPSGPITPN
jgi:fatty acid desaturase